MSEHNDSAAAASDNNMGAAEGRKDDFNDVDGPSNDSVELMEKSHFDDKKVPALKSFAKSFDANGNNNASNMSTIDEDAPSEFDPRHEQTMMAVDTMEDYSGATDKINDLEPHYEPKMMAVDTMEDYSGATDKINDIDDFGTFDDSYSSDAIIMGANPNGNIARHGSSGSDSKKNSNYAITSPTTVGNGKNHFATQRRGSIVRRTNDGLRIDASSSGENVAPSWFGSANDAATKTPLPKNITTGQGEGQQIEGQQDLEGHQEQPAISSETAELIQDISTKLDYRLKNIRNLTKTLLQEMTVYAKSNESCESVYNRVKESEFKESERLNVVEPEVIKSSEMLLSGKASVGNGDSFRRHSFPKQQANRFHTRPSAPIIGNSRQDDNGKENYDSQRRSFA